MTINDLNFPVICFSMNLVRVKTTLDSLTMYVPKGLFAETATLKTLSIVDSKGVRLNISGAKKLRGVGFLWGYNIFLNQRIKVELLTKEAPAQASITEVKELVLNSFRRWHGWATRGDFDELRDAIKNASSIPEIIALLQSRDVTRKP